MILEGFFTFEHNRPEAIRQEYFLARKHYDEVFACRDVSRPSRFRAARDRLNLAKELMFRAG